jgi:membrane-bound serine protease (ClpP class)
MLKLQEILSFIGGASSEMFMKRILFGFTFLVFCFTQLAGQKVFVIKIDGTINPVSADFIHRSIEKTSNSRGTCLVIELNTPGGLLKSTRVIVSDLLEAPVPVVVYVAPSGAHAGSAGVFITLAAHIAAMAPGTNIGAAHPVGLQGQIDTIMNAKTTNDAAAFIRTIAEKRNRNWQWSEQAVRNSISITENEALKEKIIDVIARDINDLLDKIDGRSVELVRGSTILHTKKASIETLEMGWADKILDIISDPNIAYILMLLGLYGILFELYNPGAILPGIVGFISLVLAFYAMHTLPINYAGLALIIFAIVLFLLEIKIVSHGMLAIGGIVSMFIGSIMLIRTNSTLEFVSLSRSVIITSVLTTAFFFLFIIGLGLRAQKAKPVTGVEGLIGSIGEALQTLEPAGAVKVHGEIWQAESVDGKIEKGEQVKVVAVQNLKLKVAHITPLTNNPYATVSRS